MQIIQTYNWSRRDFYYDAKCEHCQYKTSDNSGYDDAHYYNEVVPDIKCPKCGESTNSKATDTPKTVNIPKYDANITL